MRNENDILEELNERVNLILYPERIDIEIIDNIAILTGHIPSIEKKNEVAMAAAYVPGIEGVDNRLIVRAPDYIL